MPFAFNASNLIDAIQNEFDTWDTNLSASERRYEAIAWQRIAIVFAITKQTFKGHSHGRRSFKAGEARASPLFWVSRPDYT